MSQCAARVIGANQAASIRRRWCVAGSRGVKQVPAGSTAASWSARKRRLRPGQPTHQSLHGPLAKAQRPGPGETACQKREQRGSAHNLPQA